MTTNSITHFTESDAERMCRTFSKHVKHSESHVSLALKELIFNSQAKWKTFAVGLVPFLKELKITELRLSRCQINHKIIRTIIPTLLSLHSNLSSLVLDGNLICRTGVQVLGEAIIQHKLTSLDISCNLLVDTGTEALKGALPQSLTSLNLASNVITHVGALHLAELLKQNNGLTELNLRDNKIGFLGARYIAQALGFNGALRKLDLSLNTIGSPGAICLARTLSFNTGLTHLILNRNGIEEDGAYSLLELIETGLNTHLVSIDLFDNSISEGLLDSLKAAFLDNVQLSKLSVLPETQELEKND